MKTFLFRLATTAIVATSLISSAGAWSIFGSSNDENTHIPYCNDANECSIDKGTDAVKNNINDMKTNMSFTAYIQQILGYFIGFLALAAVIYIIYAGYLILTAQGDQKKVDEAKLTIRNTIIGLLIIFLAWSIVSFFLKIINVGQTTLNFPSVIEQSYAVSRAEANTFADFKEQILLLTAEMEKQYKVNDKISDTTLTRLSSLVTKAFSTLPDEDSIVYNTNLYKATTSSIEVLKKNASETSLIKLAKDLNNFLEQTKVLKIK